MVEDWNNGIERLFLARSLRSLKPLSRKDPNQRQTPARHTINCRFLPFLLLSLTA